MRGGEGCSACNLENTLRGRGADSGLVAGTATNICWESTVREAMTRDFRTFKPHDLGAAPTQDGHTAGLRNVMQAFVDVGATEDLRCAEGGVPPNTAVAVHLPGAGPVRVFDDAPSLDVPRANRYSSRRTDESIPSLRLHPRVLHTVKVLL